MAMLALAGNKVGGLGVGLGVGRECVVHRMGSGWFDYIGLHFGLLMGRNEVRRVGLRQWQAWVWRRNAMKKGMG